MKPWLTVIGLGEDGLDGLAPKARDLIAAADVLVGGARHLAKVPDGGAERLDWRDGMKEVIDAITQHRGRAVVVLASGDPMHFGVGSNLALRVPPDEMTVLPQPGAFSLAAARMGWSLNAVDCFTVHGRPLARAIRYLAPGRKLLILSRDGDTPGQLAALMTEKGYGPSRVVVLENMGGGKEGRTEGRADDWSHGRASDLNTIAVDCLAGPGAQVLARVPGLPDDAFEHDGLITKLEVRAASLAKLMPLPGQMLWDVGAGSGSVAIEWLRAEPDAQAVAIESNPERAKVIARNADALGVPRLGVVEGSAPDAFGDIQGTPDAVFVGGGTSEPGMLDACWAALRPGGRLVANGVTLEAERALLQFHADHGGALARIAVSRAAPVGKLHTFRPLKAVTQLALTKDPD